MRLRTWSGARIDVQGWRALLYFWALGWIRFVLRGFRPARCRSRIRVVSRHERRRVRCWLRAGHQGDHGDGARTWAKR